MGEKMKTREALVADQIAQMGKFALPSTILLDNGVFEIGFLHPDQTDLGDEFQTEAIGQIQFGTICESFVSDLTYWGISEYIEQWQRGLQRLLDGASTSCLLVCVPNPNNNIYGGVDWWPMYRDGEIVRFVNQGNALPLAEGTFDVTDPYKHIAPQINAEAWQWLTSITAIEGFLASVKS